MLISIKELCHIYMRGTPFESTALHGITVDFPSATCIGIAGRSGAGKSTLVQHLIGALKPSSGSISFGGIDGTTRDRKPSGTQIGLVSQNPEQQLFEKTVYAEIAFGLSRHGISGAETDIRVREALNVVGLGPELLEISPFRLSGGQKRRVAIAAALAMRPEILILDEPSAGLDPEGRRDILDSIAKLHKERGFTLVLVSSSLEDIVRMTDRLVILKEGKVALEGYTREVLGNTEALESAGMSVPPITGFMAKLGKFMPELADCILTVEEARDELKRVLRHQPEGGAAI